MALLDWFLGHANPIWSGSYGGLFSGPLLHPLH